ncbi:MAG: histidine kinase dimerization/phosphoacceptor domain -containing protein [Spirochaetales bacterium]|nr:histidine kinase dimerization/phosphoacceptor domain -containing protein [Spirochaetales bacterium]
MESSLIDIEMTLVLAVSSLEEQNAIESFLSTAMPKATIFIPESLLDLDEITKDNSIDFILTDVNFKGGSLVDWLVLWPFPFILLVNPGDEDKLESIMADEINSFIVRREDMYHIKFIPGMISKLLSNHKMRARQTSFVVSTEQQYMNLVQALPDIVYVLDTEGKFTFINNAVRDLGWEPIDLIGKHFSVLLFEEDVKRVSRTEVLLELRGKVTGMDRAPKLFDERRTGGRMTRGLQMRLRRKASVGGSVDVSLIAYGELSSVGYSGFQEPENSGLGTAGIIREDKIKKKLGGISSERSIFDTEGALSHQAVMHLINNKLQILSSLVSLKQNLATTPEESASLTAIQVQLYTLSLVYKNLVTIDGELKVRMESYLEDIIKHIISSYADNPLVQKISLHCDPIYLAEDPAITLSLMVNELLSIFLSIQYKIKTDSVPVSITFLVNEGLAQLKIKTSSEIFQAYDGLENSSDLTLLFRTLSEILKAEIFMNEDSLTLFFNVDEEERS